MCDLQLGRGFTKSGMVFPACGAFFSSHVKSCDPQLPVPAGVSATASVDERGMWGRIQSFPCDVVALSLAVSSAAASGWPLAWAGVCERCQGSAEPRSSGAQISPGLWWPPREGGMRPAVLRAGPLRSLHPIDLCLALLG